jgi:hypothetical protein
VKIEIDSKGRPHSLDACDGRRLLHELSPARRELDAAHRIEIGAKLPEAADDCIICDWPATDHPEAS